MELILSSNKDLNQFKNQIISYNNNNSLTYSFKWKPPILSKNLSRFNISDFKTFTFVRNPFERFESGLAEAVFRADKTMLLNSTELVEKYLSEILNCRPSSLLYHIEHVYPMSGELFNYDVDVAGYQENFELDWNRKVVPLYSLPTGFDLSEGIHFTSLHHPKIKTVLTPEGLEGRLPGDPSNLRYYFNKLVDEKPAYLRALCEILLIDYICLPYYELPWQCSYLKDRREEGMSILLAPSDTLVTYEYWADPTVSPTIAPSLHPTIYPTFIATMSPTFKPTVVPTHTEMPNIYQENLTLSIQQMINFTNKSA